MGHALGADALGIQAAPGHHPGGHLGQGDAGGLGDEGDGAGGTGIDLQDVDFVPLQGELAVHEAAHVQGPGEAFHLLADARLGALIEAVGRQGAGGVTGVDPGLLDVLHDAAHEDPLAVAHGVHVHLHRLVQEAVQEHGGVVGDGHRLAHVAAQFLGVVDDLHGAPAEDVGGPHHQGVAQRLGLGQGLLQGAGGGVGGLFEAQTVDELLEALSVLGQVDGIGTGADDGGAGGLQVAGQLGRRCRSRWTPSPGCS